LPLAAEPNMNQIKRYYTANASDLIALDRLVNKMIQDGWQPYGNPYKSGADYCQAMVTDREISDAESVAAANAMLHNIPTHVMRPMGR
jgi:hypothetical protein